MQTYTKFEYTAAYGDAVVGVAEPSTRGRLVLFLIPRACMSSRAVKDKQKNEQVPIRHMTRL